LVTECTWLNTLEMLATSSAGSIILSPGSGLPESAVLKGSFDPSAEILATSQPPATAELTAVLRLLRLARSLAYACRLLV
jgi:hypothetical protein